MHDLSRNENFFWTTSEFESYTNGRVTRYLSMHANPCVYTVFVFFFSNESLLPRWSPPCIRVEQIHSKIQCFDLLLKGILKEGKNSQGITQNRHSWINTILQRCTHVCTDDDTSTSEFNPGNVCRVDPRM